MADTNVPTSRDYWGLREELTEQRMRLQETRGDVGMHAQQIGRLQRATTALAVGASALAVFNLLFFVAILVIGSVLYAASGGTSIAWLLLVLL